MKSGMGDLTQVRLCRVCLLPRGTGARCTVCGWQGPGETVGAEDDPALAMIAKGEMGAAYHWLESEVRDGRESAEYCRRLAWLGLAIDDIRAVEIWCHESLRLDSQSAEPHILLGYALSREQRWPEAIEELESAMRHPLKPERRSIAETLLTEARGHIPEWG